MKTVILAGGRGTRLLEETSIRPKPMVEVGGRPIIWHIMHIYSSHGFNEFLVACGYKGEQIKDYFHNFFINNSDYFVNLKDNTSEIVKPSDVDWRVGAIDTGIDTMTGGRLVKLKKWLEDETFMVSYGDCVSNIDLQKLLLFHKEHGKIATVTAVRPPARFGALQLDNDMVQEFSEKSQAASGWINGGFFVFEPRIFDYLDGDDCILERDPLENLAQERELYAYRHEGFWLPMDTVRDKERLETLWKTGKAPWKTW
ncbi:MAG: glucose-1-phosphate cytidylyltransferase [Deltaproteobacteria bacterium]|nr:glucose-1-phosphate cytidylyltransferase [Deltaproteobacteria bacterium]